MRATTRCELYAERKDAILGRAKEIAEGRLIAGVHYRGDIEAGKRLGLAIAQELLASPAFQEDLATARQEVKSTSK